MRVNYFRGRRAEPLCARHEVRLDTPLDVARLWGVEGPSRSASKRERCSNVSGLSHVALLLRLVPVAEPQARSDRAARFRAHLSSVNHVFGRRCASPIRGGIETSGATM